MQIQFKLLKKQIQNIQNGFQIKQYFLEQKWLEGLKTLVQFSFPEEKELSESAEIEIKNLMELFLTDNLVALGDIESYKYQNMESFLKLKDKFDSITDTEFTIEMSSDEIGEFNQTLDFITRMACGQWDRWAELLHWFKNDDAYLYPYLLCIDREIDKYRNEICPYYEIKDLSYGASFGIHSKNITEEVRCLYDIYKVMMFENNQGGVYAYYPHAIAHGYPKPIIQFPYRAHIAYHGNNEELKKWVKELENLKKQVLDWGQEKEPYFDDGVWWFPLGDGKWQTPKSDETIYQTYNGYFIFVNERQV